MGRITHVVGLTISGIQCEKSHKSDTIKLIVSFKSLAEIHLTSLKNENPHKRSLKVMIPQWVKIRDENGPKNHACGSFRDMEKTLMTINRI